jgi:hypothetical protein
MIRLGLVQAALGAAFASVFGIEAALFFAAARMAARIDSRQRSLSTSTATVVLA